MSANGVLASFRPSTYPRGYAFGPSLAAALLDELFEHPALLHQPSAHRPTQLNKPGLPYLDPLLEVTARDFSASATTRFALPTRRRGSTSAGTVACFRSTSRIFSGAFCAGRLNTGWPASRRRRCWRIIESKIASRWNRCSRSAAPRSSRCCRPCDGMSATKTSSTITITSATTVPLACATPSTRCWVAR